VSSSLSDDDETTIHSCRLVTEHSIVEGGWVRFHRGRVEAVGEGPGWQRGYRPGARVVDAAGAFLTPGFVDLHCHGAVGQSFEDGADAVPTIIDYHVRHGTTRLVGSIVSATAPRLVEVVESLAACTDERWLGIHVEGPFLNHTYRGAHDPRVLRAPRDGETRDLLRAAQGRCVQVTLAPELDDRFRTIDRFLDAGVVVAVGHSAADFDVAKEAFERGASVLTHAFNGMPGIHHRAPGPVVAALRSPHVTLEMIHDGIHLHSSVVATTFAAAPRRVALITDSISATGLGDGRYRLGGLDVNVVRGEARLHRGESIAGSTITLDEALRRTVAAGVSLIDAVASVTVVPARAIRRDREFGALDPGMYADAVLLDDSLRVSAVWVSGERRSP
jgi:N-acetylglucosamine-6-phosphate deacetylase